MAGNGPAPGANPNSKDPGKRRRRNKAAELEALPADGYQGEYPALAEGYTLVIDTEDGSVEQWTKFLPATREWYEEWARSPMAVKFTAVDWGRLRRVIAPLADKLFRRSAVSLATELRLQESLLGATVMDRQRMRVRVEEPEANVSEGTVSQGRFGHLSVVLDDDAAESA